MKNILVVLCFLFLSLSVFAAERSLYDFSWLDKDKEIYVLQNRKFRKDGKAYVGALGVYTLTGKFIDSYGGGARAGYFFREDWGIELAYGKNSGSENDTAKGVKEQGAVPFYRKIDSYMGAMVMWSPFYSKINTFNKIFYFDWMLGAGVAQVKTKDNRNKFIPGANEDTLTDDDNMGAIWNTGFRFYIDESWSVRIDVTGISYKADKTKQAQGQTDTSKSSQVFSTIDLGLGLNYAF